MRILVLNYEYPPLGGGAAPVCRDLAEGMARAGHKISVVTMGFPGLPLYEEINGVEIFRLKCMRTREHVCMPWEQYSFILAAKRFLKHHLKTRQYDVCHTHFVIPTGPIAVWVKRRFGIPFVITAHGSDVEGHNGKAYIRIMHRLLRPAWRQIVARSSAAVAPSKYLLGLMGRVLQNGPYICIPNGLDISKYRSDNTMKEKRILLMGRMQKSKNFQTVFKAVSQIPDAIWDGWIVDVLGDGPYKAELENLCSELGIESRVRFHGWIENESREQLDYLERSAIYISASHFESFSMTVLEALATGCYPLISDIEGHRHFFRDVENSACYFFPADDEAIIAEKLRTLLEKDPQMLFTRFDLSNFDIKQIVMRYVEIMEKACKTCTGLTKL